jgi:hypothetical protein
MSDLQFIFGYIFTNKYILLTWHQIIFRCIFIDIKNQIYDSNKRSNTIVRLKKYDVLSAVTTCVEIYGFSVYCLKRKIEPYFTF